MCEIEKSELPRAKFDVRGLFSCLMSKPNIKKSVEYGVTEPNDDDMTTLVFQRPAQVRRGCKACKPGCTDQEVALTGLVAKGQIRPNTAAYMISS